MWAQHGSKYGCYKKKGDEYHAGHGGFVPPELGQLVEKWVSILRIFSLWVV